MKKYIVYYDISTCIKLGTAFNKVIIPFKWFSAIPEYTISSTLSTLEKYDLPGDSTTVHGWMEESLNYILGNGRYTVGIKETSSHTIFWGFGL